MTVDINLIDEPVELQSHGQKRDKQLASDALKQMEVFCTKIREHIIEIRMQRMEADVELILTDFDQSRHNYIQCIQQDLRRRYRSNIELVEREYQYRLAAAEQFLTQGRRANLDRISTKLTRKNVQQMAEFKSEYDNQIGIQEQIIVEGAIYKLNHDGDQHGGNTSQKLNDQMLDQDLCLIRNEILLQSGHSDRSYNSYQ
ncbi:hypothetical protein MP228_004936 [Amoeboaphelidium protococcarum]|nr:hypothetical protein MP228_004936 [Amoeboaphelidium protococcarum]